MIISTIKDASFAAYCAKAPLYKSLVKSSPFGIHLPVAVLFETVEASGMTLFERVLLMIYASVNSTVA